MENKLINNCLYKIFLENKEKSFLNLFDFNKNYRLKLNFIDLCIQFENNYPYSLDIRNKYEKIVLIPIINYTIKNNKISCLNHYFSKNLNPKYKTINSLLLNNYFDSFESCIKNTNINILDIVQVWLCRKLIRYPSIEKKIENIINIIYEKIKKIKDKSCCKFIGQLINMNENRKEIIKEFKKQLKTNESLNNLYQDDKNVAFNYFIELNYLNKDEKFLDYYDNLYEEDYNYLERCKKFKNLFQKISLQPLKLIN